MPNEHFDPEEELRRIKAEEGKQAMKQFLIDQATDPLTYVVLGSGGAGLLGKVG